jgi:hypothetical protein
MFGTERNIALLNEFSHWCVDWTFKVAPQFFTQVYTVHALINNRALPMIYRVSTTKPGHRHITHIKIIQSDQQGLKLLATMTT